MWIDCEDGRRVNVGISHDDITVPHPKTKKLVPTRRTSMWLVAEANEHHPAVNIIEQVTCHPDDQFCKRTGRRMARQKFLPQFEDYKVEAFSKSDGTVHSQNVLKPLKYIFTREDRKKIYACLFPEFHPNRGKWLKSLTPASVPAHLTATEHMPLPALSI